MGFEQVATVITACPCLRLTAVDKLLLIAIAHHADDDGLAFPGMTTLAAIVGVSTEHIRVRLRDLESRQLLRVTPGSGRTSSRYRMALVRLGAHAKGCQVEREPDHSRAQNPTTVGFSPLPQSGSEPDHSRVQPPTTVGFSPRLQLGRSDHRINHIISTLPAQVVEPPQLEQPNPPKSGERVEPKTQPKAAEGAEAKAGQVARQAQTEQPEQLHQSPPASIERSDAEKRAAFDALVTEAGQRLTSARAMTRDQWQAWSVAWTESGGQIEDCRIVGRWIARGGLDWLRKPKSSYLASHWPQCLAQALEDPKSRPAAPERAQPGDAFRQADAKARAAPPPPEALEELRKLGIRLNIGGDA